MANFVVNPMFWPTLENAIMRAIDDVAIKARDATKRNARRPAHVGEVVAELARRDGQGPYAVVRYGRGLGPIYEKGALNRTLKGQGKYPAGTQRGSITAQRNMARAADDAVNEGLPLHRYL